MKNLDQSGNAVGIVTSGIGHLSFEQQKVVIDRNFEPLEVFVRGGGKVLFPVKSHSENQTLFEESHAKKRKDFSHSLGKEDSTCDPRLLPYIQEKINHLAQIPIIDSTIISDDEKRLSILRGYIHTCRFLPPLKNTTRVSSPAEKTLSGKEVLCTKQGVPIFEAIGAKWEDTPVLIPIGQFKAGTNLSYENLTYIFDVINENTICQPYFIEDQRALKYQDQVAFRPNHEGTHSARQAFFVEVLISLLNIHGTEEVRNVSFSEEDQLNLLLGAYCLRIGRIDEKGSGEGEPYKERSAQVYEAYAQQLNIPTNTIEWVKRLIISGSSPFVPIEPKSKIACLLLSTAHQIDLVRCSGAGRLAPVPPAGRTSVGIDRIILRRNIHALFGTQSDQEADEKYIDPLLDFGAQTCIKTGCRVKYSANPDIKVQDYDPALFVPMSRQGGHCWQTLHELMN